MKKKKFLCKLGGLEQYSVNPLLSQYQILKICIPELCNALGFSYETSGKFKHVDLSYNILNLLVCCWSEWNTWKKKTDKEQSREAKSEQKGREAEQERKRQKMAALIKFLCFPPLFHFISSAPLVSLIYYTIFIQITSKIKSLPPVSHQTP